MFYNRLLMAREDNPVEQLWDEVRAGTATAAAALGEKVAELVGPFDILEEKQPFGRGAGEVRVEKGATALIGAVLLAGDYVDDNDVIARSPSAVHLENEQLAGRHLPLLAELVFGQELLDALTEAEVTLGDFLAKGVRSPVVLEGFQVSHALAATSLLAEAKPDRLDHLFPSPTQRGHAETLRGPAQDFVGAAKRVRLRERTVPSFGRPLVKPRETPDHRGRAGVPEHLLRRLAEREVKGVAPHLLERSRQRRAALGIQPAEPTTPPEETPGRRIPVVPEAILQRSKTARRSWEQRKADQPE